jgi:DNA-binding NarL/FixJ family response regulator
VIERRKSKSLAQKSRILIVDDHPVVRHGLCRMIDQENDLTVCGEAESADEALTAVADTKPDLVLVDLSLRSTPGLELIKSIRAQHPHTPVLVLSMHDESLWAERVLRAGACGFVMKQEKPRVLIARIRQALTGGLCLSEPMAQRLLRKFTGQSPAKPSTNVDGVGDRELQVLQLIGQGMNTRDIASAMHVSVKTIEAHRENLKRKLGLSSGAELLRYAIVRFLGE